MKKNIQDKYQNIKNQITEVLSKQLGIEPSDLHEEDSFKEDLHMGPAEFTDFLEALTSKNPNLPELDSEEIRTIGELTDFFRSKEEI